VQQPIFKRSVEAGRVVVNFNGDLVELMRETRYLDRMGFAIPEIALNVALQVRVLRQLRYAGLCAWL
jgi:dynein heavy chain